MSGSRSRHSESRIFSAILAASTTIRLTVFQSKSFGTISFACKLRVNKLNINVKQKGHYSIAVMAVKAYCQVLNLSPLGLDSPLGVWGMLLAQAAWCLSSIREHVVEYYPP